ncbi:SET domain-containing protein [Perilla frutescens var. frutescens]|nr:SET domain-containing protein [Perilla frutescens var. frutescens]
MDLHNNENDEVLRLALELRETGPFFQQKKLLETSLNVENPVCIKSSYTPDQLKDLLNLLIKRARIINFNEVELYFGGDIDNLEHCMSPRNELEAFHSILEAINKSVSSESCTMKNIKQMLEEEIVDRIHEVGNKFREETRIVGDSSVGKEKGVLDWGVNNGMKTKVDIAYVEGAGRGAIAREDLKVGDIALEIPVSVIISGELLHESDMFPIFEKIDGISEETMLLLWSMKEKHRKESRFRLYFDTLPENFNTGLSFGIDAIMALDGTLLLEEIVQAKEHLRAQYDELFPALSDNYPDIFPSELYTWEQFLWACELWYSNSMKVIFPDGKLRTCLIPVAGFLNHSICPHIMHYGRVDASTNSLTFPLSRPCRSGEQCFLSYGNFSSSHLLTFYGFLPRGDNPYDIIPLDIDVAQDEESEVVTPTTEWSSHMVRGTWLSKNHRIFHYGLPPPLLDHLRKTRNLASQSNTPTHELLETDLNVLEGLSSTFQEMMEALGDENQEDRESAGWDVKLAIEFKSLQRRIISSILTSCDSGSEEVQQSADIMESAYRAWLRARKEGLISQHLDTLNRELQMALGTAKWQLEEFERAVCLSYRSSGDDITNTRHREFVSAIEDQISRVETALKESLEVEGKKPFRWVNLDKEECDDLAHFLSGTPGTSQMIKDDCIKGKSSEEVPISIKDISSFIELQERKISETGHEISYRADHISSNQTVWSSLDRNTLEIVIDIDDRQTNGLTEATPEDKGSKPFIWRSRALERTAKSETTCVTSVAGQIYTFRTSFDANRLFICPFFAPLNLSHVEVL